MKIGLSFVALAMALAACGAPPVVPAGDAPATAPPPARAAAKAGCDAPVAEPDAGFGPESRIPPEAIGVPGKGNLCPTAKAFVAMQQKKVYRVYTANYQGTKFAGPTGAYWTFEKPRTTDTKASYRAQYVICEEWNQLDTIEECTLDAGTTIVVGPGQSATCASGAFEASAANQVFVLRNPDGRIPVLDCKSSPMTWR